jgi:hypothetical protein
MTAPSPGQARRPPSRTNKEILTEIDDSLRYRVGWPRPLPVSPVRMEVILNDEERYIPAYHKDVKPRIRAILDAARVPYMFQSPFLAFCATHSQEESTAEDNLTIVIQSPSRHQSTTTWVQPLVEIREYLKDRSLHLRIEIADLDALAHRISLPVHHSDPIVDTWEANMRARVLDIVKQTRWQSINVLRRGDARRRSSTAECAFPITLVISAWDSHELHMWLGLRARIREFWGFEIELLSAERLDCTTGGAGGMDDCRPRADGFLSADAFAGPLHMGASVGLNTERGVGTCGGFVRLEWPDGQESEIGLTSREVVLSDGLEPGEQAQSLHPGDLPMPEPSGGRAFSSGHSSPNQALSIVSPSNHDHDTSLNTLEAAIQNFRQRIHEVQESGTERARAALHNTTRQLADLEHQKAQIQSSSRDIGRVIASSGDRRTAVFDQTEWPLNWAAINLSHGTTSSTTTSNNMIVNPPLGNPMAAYHGVEVSTRSTDLSPDANVSKVARSTGWTAGRVNAIKTDLRVYHHQRAQECNRDACDQVSAWVVPTPPTESGRRFTAPRDAGAWILRGWQGIPGSECGWSFLRVPGRKWLLVLCSLPCYSGGR